MVGQLSWMVAAVHPAIHFITICSSAISPRWPQRTIPIQQCLSLAFTWRTMKCLSNVEVLHHLLTVHVAASGSIERGRGVSFATRKRKNRRSQLWQSSSLQPWHFWHLRMKFLLDKNLSSRFDCPWTLQTRLLSCVLHFYTGALDFFPLAL